MKNVLLNINRIFYILQHSGLLLLVFVLIFHIPLLSQKLTIDGVVNNENHAPLTGVNIILNNGEFATISNSNGKFRFSNIPKKEYILEISFIGYKKDTFLIFPDKENIILKIKMQPFLQSIDEVVINGDRKEQIKKMESNNIEFISKDFIEENASGSFMQTIKKRPGINSIDIGSGLSKPMIRGLSYYRVVVAENGIKQEGQQWSAHHGLEIDQFTVEDVEIFKGPASLRYGSDAIGGVINILSNSFPEQETTSGEISMIGKTNNEWLGISGKISTRRNDFFLKASCTYNNYADYKVPADSFEYKPMHYAYLENSLINTAGKELAASFQTGVIKNWGNSYFVISNYYHHNGFFAMARGEELVNFNRTDHQASNRDILLPHQKVNHTSINHFTNLFFDENKLEIALGFQNNLSQEYDRLEDITGNRSEDFFKYRKNDLDLEYNLTTYSGNVVYSIKKFYHQTISIGFNSQYQKNFTDGFNHLLPEYSRFTMGVYATHKYNFNDKWIWNNGVRVDYGIIELNETINPDIELGDSVFNPYLKNIYPSFVYSTGLNYISASGYLLKFNIGKSFRMPAAYELGSYGIHKHTLRFEKGDPDLSPEEAYQADIVFEKTSNNYSIRITPFINYFSNYIYLTPTPDFALGTFTGQVYEYRQNKASLCGGEMQIRVNPIKKLSFEVNGEYVYAVNLDSRSALPYTPPLSSLSGIYYSPISNDNRIGFEVLIVVPQKLVAINEYSTNGYSSFNFIAKTKINFGNQVVNFVFQIQNLFNTKYFNHLSYYRRLQIPEQGRNIQLFISVPFQIKTNKSKFSIKN